MSSSHMKRLTMPRTWPLPRKTNVWVQKPDPSGHPLEMCMPIGIILRDVLKLSRSVAHSVLTAPFAMAIIRLRLSQMDASLEAAAWNLGADQWRALRRVIVPFCRPAIISSFCLTAAVSFDEFAIAWFISGLNKTIPVIILEIVTGNIDPQVNAIGSFVFLTSITLVVIAQVVLMTRDKKEKVHHG